MAWWGGVGGGGAACALELIRRRLLLDVCSCCVSRNASVSVARRRLVVACPSPVFKLFGFCNTEEILGFSDSEEVKYRNMRLSHYI